jgi:hypothetical protein
MEKKFTPGPWTVKHSESKPAYNVVGTVIGCLYKIARCSYYIIPDIVNDHNRKEQEANAKLIAAAPELLDALIDAYLALYQGNCKTLEQCLRRGEEHMDDFERKLVHAIKKATE